MNVKRADDHNEAIEDLKTNVFSYKEMLNNFFSRSTDNQPTVFDGEQVGGYKLLFWPAALGVTIARILGFGFVPALFMGRLFNLACYVFLTTLAVKFAPFKKGVFVVVGLLPVTMHLAASFNRDVLTIGLYIFFTAYCFYLGHKKTAITLKDIIILAAVSLLALPAKVVYAPLLLPLFTLDLKKIRIKGKLLSEKSIKIIKWSIIVCCSVLLVISIFPYVRGTLKPPKDPALAKHPDDVRYTTVYILSHLKQTVWMIANTIFENTAFYLNTMVGGKLGYFNIDISWFFVIAFYLLIVAAILPEKGEKLPGKGMRKLGLIASAITFLLVVFACINWTPTYYLTIYGIQGRYFLPLLPMLLCLVPGNRVNPVIQKTKNIDRGLLFCGFAFSVFVTLNAFLVIIVR